DQEPLLVPGPCRVLGRGHPCGRGLVALRPRRPNLVPGGFHGTDDLGTTRTRWVDRDRRALRREVHRRLEDAIGALEVPLDAVDARGTRHALDGQRELTCRRIRVAGGSCRHTPPEYTRDGLRYSRP